METRRLPETNHARLEAVADRLDKIERRLDLVETLALEIVGWVVVAALVGVVLWAVL